jgi:hypothetical protein
VGCGARTKTLKVIVHACHPALKDVRKKWIEEEIKLPIFKEETASGVGDDPLAVEYRFYLVVMHEEDLSALQLKYPAATFKNL